MSATDAAGSKLARAEIDVASQRICNELATVGVSIRSIGSRIDPVFDTDLVAPVLMKHLAMDHPYPVQEALARNLAAIKAVNFLGELVRIFEASVDAPLPTRYAMGLAVAAGMRTQDLATLSRLIRDPALGEARVALLSALKRYRRRPAMDEAIQFAKRDSQLSREVDSWK